MKRTKLLIVMVVCFALSLSMVSCKKKKSEEKKEGVKKEAVDTKKGEKEQKIYNVVLGNAPSMGEKNAPVTVINFSDFQCPFSKRSVDMMNKVMKDYKGKIKYVFKHFPLGFHKEAKPAAKAAIAAKKQGKFWEMYNKLFDNHKKINEQNLKKWAKEIGLDMTQFEKDYISQDTQTELSNDMKQGSTFGVRGTPTMFVNGIRIVGANTPKIEKAIKEQIVVGEQLKAKGVSDVYTELVKNGSKKYVAPKRKPPAIAKDIYKVSIPEHAPVWGKEEAPVTIVLFDDFECPFCARLYNTFEQLKKDYTDEIRIVFVHLPLKFHKKAIPAAKASIAAQKQGKFWEMYSKLFKEQKQWRKKKDVTEYFQKAAKEIGLDMGKFKKDFADNKVQQIIDQDMAAAAKLGVRGTPGSFINGRFIGGAYPIESFKTVIDEEVKRAKPFVEKGMKGNDLYKELVKNGKTEIARRRKRGKEDPNKVYKVSLAGHEPLKGNKNAKITIIEFSEFQCPFCKRASDTVAELLQEYKGKVNLKFKHMPLAFHKKATPAAKFTIAVKKVAGDEKFYKVHDMVFSNQKEWSKGDHMKIFQKYAQKAGVNWNKVKKEMESAAVDAILKKDMAEASKHGVRGVPGFFINGKKISGAQPKAKFKALIDKMLKSK